MPEKISSFDCCKDIYIIVLIEAEFKPEFEPTKKSMFHTDGRKMSCLLL